MRILAPKLSEMLGQTCVVENRAGAGGVVGTDIVTKSAPDGYTLGHCTVSQVVIAPALYERLPFAPEKDLTPISPTVFVPMCLSVTRKGLKVNSVQELVAEMRANPGKLSYASNGIGATSHLAGANLLRLTRLPGRARSLQERRRGHPGAGQWRRAMGLRRAGAAWSAPSRRQPAHPHGVARPAAADPGRAQSHRSRAAGIQGLFVVRHLRPRRPAQARRRQDVDRDGRSAGRPRRSPSA